MNFAIIENGVVTNIIWISENQKDNFKNGIPLSDLVVFIGDLYHDGYFWRDGERVKTGTEALIDIEERNAAQITYTAMMTDTLLQED